MDTAPRQSARITSFAGARVDSHRRVAGFTLVELLVVIAVIGILAGMLLPALSKSKEAGNSARCMSNLHEIGLATMQYANDNHETFYCDAKGTMANGGQWTSKPTSTVLLPATDQEDAYWALGYYSYFGGVQKLFSCPDGTVVDQWRDAGLNYPFSFWANSSYGVCQYLTDTYTGAGTQYGVSAKKPLSIPRYLSPQSTIFCQDATEQRMEGDDDSLGLFPGQTQILTQWNSGSSLQVLYPGVDLTSGWWRHNSNCNTLWLQGNVSVIKHVPLSVGIDYRYYTGEVPAVMPHF